nr:uncharacterized protein LOC127304102 [Lolium perenne]
MALEGDLDDGAPVPLLFLHPCVLPVELLETWAAGEVPEGRAGVLAELEPPAYLGDGGRTSPCGSLNTQLGPQPAAVRVRSKFPGRALTRSNPTRARDFSNSSCPRPLPSAPRRPPSIPPRRPWRPASSPATLSAPPPPTPPRPRPNAPPRPRLATRHDRCRGDDDGRRDPRRAKTEAGGHPPLPAFPPAPPAPVPIPKKAKPSGKPAKPAAPATAPSRLPRARRRSSRLRSRRLMRPVWRRRRRKMKMKMSPRSERKCLKREVVLEGQIARRTTRRLSMFSVWQMMSPMTM